MKEKGQILWTSICIERYRHAGYVILLWSMTFSLCFRLGEHGLAMKLKDARHSLL